MRIVTLSLGLSLALLPSVARAQDNETRDHGVTSEASTDPPAVAPGFGLRFGGYGFRRPGTSKWDDCRMNGIGIFGTLDIGKHGFVEAGFDSYQSAPGDADMQDRTSLATTVAGGLRMFPDFVITPNVHAGGGVEWTRVEQPGSRIQGLYPLGFFGVGLEANILKSLKAGANLRFLGMAHPRESDDAATSFGAKPPAPSMEMQLASQGQFFVRYVL